MHFWIVLLWMNIMLLIPICLFNCSVQSQIASYSTRLICGKSQWVEQPDFIVSMNSQRLRLRCQSSSRTKQVWKTNRNTFFLNKWSIGQYLLRFIKWVLCRVPDDRDPFVTAEVHENLQKKEGILEKYCLLGGSYWKKHWVFIDRVRWLEQPFKHTKFETAR